MLNLGNKMAVLEERTGRLGTIHIEPWKDVRN